MVELKLEKNRNPDADCARCDHAVDAHALALTVDGHALWPDWLRVTGSSHYPDKPFATFVIPICSTCWHQVPLRRVLTEAIFGEQVQHEVGTVEDIILSEAASLASSGRARQIPSDLVPAQVH